MNENLIQNFEHIIREILLVTVCYKTLQVTGYKTITSVFKAEDEGMGVKKIIWLQDYLMYDDEKKTTFYQGKKKKWNRKSRQSLDPVRRKNAKHVAEIRGHELLTTPDIVRHVSVIIIEKGHKHLTRAAFSLLIIDI